MSKLLKCLIEGENSYNPIWFMRQAGRYLPEFREIRSKNLDFIKLCLNSNLSSEITLQPINRFGLDAAIIFSDILIVPHALGQKVYFEKGEGPRLSEFFTSNLEDDKVKNYTSILDPVYKAINITRDKLDKNRKYSPLKKTKDSILINTTKLSKKSCFYKIKAIMDNKIYN